MGTDGKSVSVMENGSVVPNCLAMLGYGMNVGFSHVFLSVLKARDLEPGPLKFEGFERQPRGESSSKLGSECFRVHNHASTRFGSATAVHEQGGGGKGVSSNADLE